MNFLEKKVNPIEIYLLTVDIKLINKLIAKSEWAIEEYKDYEKSENLILHLRTFIEYLINVREGKFKAHNAKDRMKAANKAYAKFIKNFN